MPDAPPSGKPLLTLFFAVVLVGALMLFGVLWFVVQNGWLSDSKYQFHNTSNELMQLSVALENLKTKFGSYPPSRIKLSETGSYNLNDSLDKESIAFLTQMWPRIKWQAGIDWNGNSKIDTLKDGGDVILEGDQCLVFFLGGIPRRTNGEVDLHGFSANANDPSQPGENWIGPFFKFDRRRLVTVHGNPFISFLDPYGIKPFAYFSAYGKHNGYNPWGTTDCTALGVWPYASALAPAIDYWQSNSFQLISAGPDGRFGTGTALPNGKTWNPATADQIDPEGRDDLSSFYHKSMGTPG